MARDRQAPALRPPLWRARVPAYAGGADIPARQRVQDLYRVRRGAEFIRVFAEERYGIPPEQVVGSRIVTKYERRDGRPSLFRLPQVDFIDDGPGKPVGINQEIGRRPVAAFGNSDGDLEMLQWTTEAGKRRLGVVVHHTDAEREYAYDRQSHVGKLDKALDAAAVDRWTVVDMKRDWKTIFPVRQ
jgi:hypothetical protein